MEGEGEERGEGEEAVGVVREVGESGGARAGEVAAEEEESFA